MPPSRLGVSQFRSQLEFFLVSWLPHLFFLVGFGLPSSIFHPLSSGLEEYARRHRRFGGV